MTKNRYKLTKVQVALVRVDLLPINLERRNSSVTMVQEFGATEDGQTYSSRLGNSIDSHVFSCLQEKIS